MPLLPSERTLDRTDKITIRDDSVGQGCSKSVDELQILSKTFSLQIVAEATDVATGDGKASLAIGPEMNGWDLVAVMGVLAAKGVTGSCDIQLRRAKAGVDADMLTTKVTIGDEFFAADGVIDATKDDVATGDMIYVDVDAIHSGTAPKGLVVVLTFADPIM